jgi:hypothetical protein
LKLEAIESDEETRMANSGGYNTILTLEDLDAIEITIKEQQE